MNNKFSTNIINQSKTRKCFILFIVQTQQLFPAVFAWGQYDDFKEQVSIFQNQKWNVFHGNPNNFVVESTFAEFYKRFVKMWIWIWLESWPQIWTSKGSVWIADYKSRVPKDYICFVDYRSESLKTRFKLWSRIRSIFKWFQWFSRIQQILAIPLSYSQNESTFPYLRTRVTRINSNHDHESGAPTFSTRKSVLLNPILTKRLNSTEFEYELQVY